MRSEGKVKAREATVDDSRDERRITLPEMVGAEEA
jgi:hypothetical protein